TAGASVGQLAAVARQQVAAGGPAEAADLGRRRGGGNRATRLRGLSARCLRLLAGTLLGGPLLGRGPRGGGAQVLQQLLQRLRILAQRLLALLAVLVPAVQVPQQSQALATVPLQLRQRLLLPGAQRFEFGTTLGDAFLDRGKLRQRFRQRPHLAGVFALGIAVVGQGALGVGGAVLRQQQLQRGLATQGVGRAQQPGQALAAAGLLGPQLVAAPFQPSQGLRFALQRLLGPGQFALGTAQLLLGPTQARLGLAALAFQPAAFTGDFLQFGANLAQFALG